MILCDSLEMTNIIEIENILVVAKYSGRESGEQRVWL